MSKAFAYWLIGPSGSGKTTIGTLLTDELAKRYGEAEFIDGDKVREFFDNDLGFSEQERFEVTKRISFAAAQLVLHGIHTVVANIAAKQTTRDFIKRKLGPAYKEIYLKASLNTLIARDNKGVYSRIEHKNNIVGVDLKFEEPLDPFLTIDTELNTPADCLEIILRNI